MAMPDNFDVRELDRNIRQSNFPTRRIGSKKGVTSKCNFDLETSVTFIELCPDGIYCPVTIEPALVRGVQYLDQAYKIGDNFALTLIHVKESDDFSGYGNMFL